MAVTRIPTKEQQQRTRAAIQTTQLVKRLQFFALGIPDDARKAVEIDGTRQRAIEILLKKSLPDMASVQPSDQDDTKVFDSSHLSLEQKQELLDVINPILAASGHRD